MKHLVLVLFLLLGSISSGTALAAELRVAVAANFLGTLQQLVALYEAHSEDRITLSAGSSGALYAQIANGAPFDLFFSADDVRTAALIDAGLADADSRVVYALGVPVLWTAADFDLSDPPALLASDRYRFLAIADPRNAPYGIAAQQILTQFDLWDALNRAGRLVRAQTLTQVYAQVASGAADLGFIALAQIKDSSAERTGNYWIPPEELYDPITQEAVLLTRTAHPEAARRFLDWIQSEPAIAVIEAAGYRIPR